MENGVPPAGDDQGRGVKLLGVTWSLTLISIAFVSLRIYTRLRLVQKLWWDDFLAVIAVVLAAPLPVMWIFYVRDGGSRHLSYLSPAQREASVRLNWISQPFGILSIGVAKAAVAFFILRFQSPHKWRTRILYFIAASIIFLSILNIILEFVQCKPVRTLWMPQLLEQGAHCWAPAVFEDYVLAQNAYSASLDFAMVFISTMIIWRLKLSLRIRIQLALLLSTGVLDGVMGIIKTTKLTEQSARSDYTWNTFPLFVWTIVELHCIIIGMCIPTLRPLYLVVFNRPGKEAYSSANSRNRRHNSTLEIFRLNKNFSSRPPHAERMNSLDETILPSTIRHTVEVDVSSEDGNHSQIEQKTAISQHRWEGTTSNHIGGHDDGNRQVWV